MSAAKPSAEAVEAAMRHRITAGGCCPACSPHGTIEEGPAGATWTESCPHGGLRQQAMRYLNPAYAVDRPRIRAAMRDEIVAWLREARRGQGICGDEGAWLEAADAIEREFSTEAMA